MAKLLAIDIGAESGRAILGILEDGILKLKEIHRFQNGPINIMGSYHWNIYQLYQEIIKAITICVEEEKVQPDSIGIDTWGVDYGLLNKDGNMIGLPYAYRDSRTDMAIEKFSKLKLYRAYIFSRSKKCLNEKFFWNVPSFFFISPLCKLTS